MPRKSIRTAEWNDAEGARRLAVFGDNCLQDFVNCSVASAGEDHVRTGRNGLTRLNGG
jgi:hypothetical protein